MSGYPGTVGLTGGVAPADTLDTYAVTYEEFNQGGFRSVANVTELYAIYPSRRKIGMLVYIEDLDEYRTLKTGITNSDWVTVPIGVAPFPILTIQDDNATDYLTLPDSNQTLYIRQWWDGTSLDVELPSAADVEEVLIFNDWDSGATGNGQLYINGHGSDIIIHNGINHVIYNGLNNKPGSFVRLRSDGVNNWYVTEYYNGSGTSEPAWDELTLDSGIGDEGQYFINGDIEVTILHMAIQRRISFKVISGTCILKTESGIIDGDLQDVTLTKGSSIEVLCRDNDTYFIKSLY